MIFIVVGMKRMEVVAPDKQGSWDLTIGKEGVTFLFEKTVSCLKIHNKSRKNSLPHLECMAPASNYCGMGFVEAAAPDHGCELGFSSWRGMSELI